MSFRFLAGCLVLALCGASLCRAQKAHTNAAPAAAPAPTPGTDRLKQLEDQLSKSLESFSPKHMLDNAQPQLNPPLTPPVPQRRVRQSKDRNQDWMLLDTDDPASMPGEQWLKEGDLNSRFSNKDKKRNDLELFYEQLSKQREALRSGQAPRPGGPFSLPSAQDQKEDPDDKLPGMLKGPAQRLKQFLSDDKERVFNPTPQRGFADWFGLKNPDSTLTPDEIKAHKAYMDDYRKLLDSSAPQLTSPLATTTPGKPSPLMPGYGGLDSLKNNPRPSATAGPAGVFINPGLLPDHNATVLNQWNPLYIAPKPEEPKSMPLFSPPVQMPRRSF